jgi:hypothetical protein
MKKRVIFGFSSFALLLVLSMDLMAVPSNIVAEFRKGQTFITFQEDSSTSYKIYRSDAPITSVYAMTPVAILQPNSGANPSGGRHVITDLGNPLPVGTGLVVLTPKSTGMRYYAVTSVKSAEDTSVSYGVNSIETPVYEDYTTPIQGVLLQEGSADTLVNAIYRYYLWMDYETWPHGREYYGSMFAVNEYYTVRNKKLAPLYIYLHALNSASGINESLNMNGMIRINIWDYNNTWWFGNGNDNYTQRRLIAAIDAVINDTTRFNIDTNRIYLEGQSMGGRGTMHLGICYPEKFACIKPNLAPIYSWMADTILRHPERELPPVVDFFGFKDSDVFGRNGHSYLYGFFKLNKFGIFGKWQNIGHQGGNSSDVVRGGIGRFLKNEPYPAFSGSNRDWNYGQYADKPLDSSGYMNSYYDWGSSLYRLSNIDNDTLVDSPDSAVIVIRSLRDSSIVDVTFRRLQNFCPAIGTRCCYVNRSISTGSVTDSGISIYNGGGCITMPGLTLRSAGNRITVTPENGIQSETVRKSALSEVTIRPNPLSKSANITIKIPEGHTLKRAIIYNINGKQVAILGKTSYDSKELPQGYYFVDILTNKGHYRKGIVICK